MRAKPPFLRACHIFLVCVLLQQSTSYLNYISKGISYSNTKNQIVAAHANLVNILTTPPHKLPIIPFLVIRTFELLRHTLVSR